MFLLYVTVLLPVGIIKDNNINHNQNFIYLDVLISVRDLHQKKSFSSSSVSCHGSDVTWQEISRTCGSVYSWPRPGFLWTGTRAAINELGITVYLTCLFAWFDSEACVFFSGTAKKLKRHSPQKKKNAKKFGVFVSYSDLCFVSASTVNCSEICCDDIQ